MSLHDQIGEDLSIFLDLDDLATEHTICLPGNSEEKKISVIIDNDQGQQNALKAQGVYTCDLLFYAKSSDVTGIAANSMIQFDGRPYQVVSPVEEDGMTQVALQACAGGF